MFGRMSMARVHLSPLLFLSLVAIAIFKAFLGSNG
jgi:hypothetical protein